MIYLRAGAVNLSLPKTDANIGIIQSVLNTLKESPSKKPNKKQSEFTKI